MSRKVCVICVLIVANAICGVFVYIKYMGHRKPTAPGLEARVRNVNHELCLEKATFESKFLVQLYACCDQQRTMFADCCQQEIARMGAVDEMRSNFCHDQGKFNTPFHALLCFDNAKNTTPVVCQHNHRESKCNTSLEPSLLCIEKLMESRPNS